MEKIRNTEFNEIFSLAIFLHNLEQTRTLQVEKLVDKIKVSCRDIGEQNEC